MYTRAMVGMTPARVPLVLNGPCVRILGPVDLVGATGEPPGRSRGQALEMLVWLLCHPDATAAEMMCGLSIAEGTRRAVLCRLRAWLGRDVKGQLYVPLAYEGRVRVQAAVTSDWQRVQALTHGGQVADVSTWALINAMGFFRGPVLADAPLARWHWADGLRADADATMAAIAGELHVRRVNVSRFRAQTAPYGGRRPRETRRVGETVGESPPRRGVVVAARVRASPA